MTLLSGSGLLVSGSGVLISGTLLSGVCVTTGRFVPGLVSVQLAIESTRAAASIIAANFFIVVRSFQVAFEIYTNELKRFYWVRFHKFACG